MKKVLAMLIIASVVAQPLLGWTAIPRFFEHSVVAAVLLGVCDGLLIVLAVWLVDSDDKYAR